MKFTNGRCRFKRLARVALCLGLCAMLLGTNGVFGVMAAFADEVTHRYGWKHVPNWSEGVPIPYGHAVRYIDPTTGAISQTPYLYRVVTGKDASGLTAWGRVGRGLSSESPMELKYDWDDGSKTLKTHTETDDGDIKVVYDNSKPITEHKDGAFEDGATVYIGITASTGGGAVNISFGSYGTVTADFIDNNASTSTGWIGGGAIKNYNTTIDAIEGDFINNYAHSDDSGVNGGAIASNGGSAKIIKIAGDFIGNRVSSFYG